MTQPASETAGSTSKPDSPPTVDSNAGRRRRAVRDAATDATEALAQARRSRKHLSQLNVDADSAIRVERIDQAWNQLDKAIAELVKASGNLRKAVNS